MTDTYVLLGILNEHAPKMPLGVAHTVAEKIVDTFRPVIDDYRAEATRQRNLHQDACAQLKRQAENIVRQATDIERLEEEIYKVNRMLIDERRRTTAPVQVINQVQISHDSLVQIARAVPEITDAIKERKKIIAIKALRSMTGCGLLEAKNAVETATSVIFNG